MISVNAGLTALINDIKANSTTVKTVKSFEGDFDIDELKKLVPLVPFVLISYGGLGPQERGANESAVLKRCRFFFIVGSSSLLSETDAAKGCDVLLQFLRTRYDGKSLSTADGPIELSLQSENPLINFKGLVIYSAEYSYFDE